MSSSLTNQLIPILKKIGVSRISNITGYEDSIVYTYQSVRPNAQHLIVDSGKGLDENSAFISCAVEAIERYAAEEHIDAGEMINFEQIPKHVRNSCDKNIACKKIKAVKFTEYSTKDDFYLPKQLIDYKNRTSDSLSLKSFFSGTTGLGAHTDINMAIYSGLIEILERDAIAEDCTPIIIDLDSLPNNTQKYVKWIQENVGDIELRHHKSRHDIYVFSCSCWNSEVIGGFNSMGASVNKQEALINCFMEGIQTWLMRISGTRDDWIFSKRSLHVKTQHNKDHTKYSNINEVEHIASLNDQKFQLLNKFDQLFIYRYLTNVDLTPIKVVKVVLPNTSKLEQGEMFTGVPRGQIT